LEICRSWLNENQQRFKRVELVTSEKNTGIAPNCNRGLKIAKGEWVKFIAGDDILYPNCIYEFITFSKNNTQFEIIFSNIIINGNKIAIREELIKFFEADTKDQLRILLIDNILAAPSAFFKKITLNQLGDFNEDYPMLEDYPLFLKALKNGIKFYRINKDLVFYRKHDSNITFNELSNKQFIVSLMNFYKMYYLKELIKQKMFLTYFHYKLKLLLVSLSLKNIISNNTYNKVFNWLGPLFWQRRLRNLIMNRTTYNR